MAAFIDIAPPPAIACDADAATPASSPRRPPREDPWEKLNRGLFHVGTVADRIAFRPLAMSYRRWLPGPIRRGLHNVLANLDEPVIAINDGLQGRPLTAGKTALRFAANTTIGVVGVFDPARHVHLPHHDNDFGVTLGIYHVSAGPYVYVPLLGPSSVRGLLGAGVDYAIDPLNWLQYRSSTEISAGATILGALDTRAEVDTQLTDLYETAIDPYAALRSIYLQSKASQVRGDAVDLNEMPDFPEEAPPPDAPTPGASPPLAGAPTASAGAAAR